VAAVPAGQPARAPGDGRHRARAELGDRPGLDNVDLAVADAWFALVEYGSDKQHPTNAGSLVLKLTRTS
jgi:hypothetical protein